MEAAYEVGVGKFLWLASTTGYPPSGDHQVKEDEMFDGEPYDKYYFAGWTKRFTEILSRMYGEKLAKPMTTIVLRPTNIYGPNDDFEFATSHVVPALIRKVVERWNPLEVWGTGNDVRDMIYIDDMIDAMILAMQKVDAFDAINIGLGKGHSIKEILSMILDIDGFTDSSVVYDASKPSMIPIRLVDTAKATEVLGFEAKVDLQEGLRRTIGWYRSSGAGLR
jgi:GDP-L-fucose synthase